MTDTKVPERLVTSKCGKTIVHDGMKRFEGDIEWVPYDHALSLVGAASVRCGSITGRDIGFILRGGARGS